MHGAVHGRGGRLRPDPALGRRRSLVFEALGLGPGAAVPRCSRWCRRGGASCRSPGAWMERLKQLLAFPLYASVAWLVWVVSQQAGPTGVAAVAGGPRADRASRRGSTRPRGAARRWRRAAAARGLAARRAARRRSGRVGRRSRGAPPARRAAPAASAGSRSAPRRLAELRAQGKPVFVNFTAAWCITCLVNERVALRSPAVAEAFARKGVVTSRPTGPAAMPADHRGARRRSGAAACPSTCSIRRARRAGRRGSPACSRRS